MSEHAAKAYNFHGVQGRSYSQQTALAQYGSIGNAALQAATHAPQISQYGSLEALRAAWAGPRNTRALSLNQSGSYMANAAARAVAQSPRDPAAGPLLSRGYGASGSGGGSSGPSSQQLRGPLFGSYGSGGGFGAATATDGGAAGQYGSRAASESGGGGGASAPVVGFRVAGNPPSSAIPVGRTGGAEECSVPNPSDWDPLYR